MLEHMESKNREKAVGEMLRVARKKVIIALPCGKQAKAEDEFLTVYYRLQFSRDYIFIAQHNRYGLPDCKTVRSIISRLSQSLRKKTAVSVYGNENILLHRFLMKGFMTKNIFVDFIYRKVLLFVIPILRMFNEEPTYRKIFCIDLL
ncbi:hypothetical protein A2Y99_02355 [Candidatus Gottesmanbacteria bacterium RBG_13_37_7]|uniref:Methyltransferase type 11 domain-containing protein n=1 Tax=Candidatus Gottesmanbacteria bacterium RBG_13_37_7 TaxID=1798369 RepID=A0A1F5YHY7_9BACT|nr:MAG: hypothetical protein A2Y99_02355 [Candidatus Gottesmanbacteria bacterium RBG_13_37_7]